MNSIINNLKQAKLATASTQSLSIKKRNAVLHDAAEALLRDTEKILTANKRDFSKLHKDYPHADRLLLTADRIHGMATGLQTVARLPDPIGRVIDRRTIKKSGLRIQRRTVPIGVIGIIYEARPNVTVEIFSLSVKSGNVVVLKGGRDAHVSNKALANILKSVLKKHRVDVNVVTLLDPFRKESTDTLLAAREYVDLIIPRGSNRLIDFVRDHARIPTIETGAGVCHTYVEKTANLKWATEIVVNAKTRRPSVCNALDTLVVDQCIAKKLLTGLAQKLADKNVAVFADNKSYTILRPQYPRTLLKHARNAHFGREFLSLQMSVKIVNNASDGIAFVQKHTSGHSESIITANKEVADRFQQLIDAAVIYVNTSTAFTDGFEFGLGSEIGISTQKLHARGPMALQELTTYKWFVESKGSIRPR